MELKPGKYRHFKGGEYELMGIAKHSETLEPMVVYRALYGEGGLWVRPAAMWNETVERDGKTFYDHYCVKADVPLEKIVLLPGETVDAKWVTLPQIHEMIDRKQICHVIAAQFLRQEPELLKRIEL